MTLHIGLDTFQPVKVEEIDEHPMHSEVGQPVIGDSARSTTQTLRRWPRRRGWHHGRTYAGVGGHRRAGDWILTMWKPALETHSGLRRAHGPLHPPGYRFRAVGAMITNFHLPRSTLLMLVSAFAGKDLIDHAYQGCHR